MCVYKGNGSSRLHGVLDVGMTLLYFLHFLSKKVEILKAPFGCFNMRRPAR